MPRPRKQKRIGETPKYFNFFTEGGKKTVENTLNLTLEEYETIYLIDYKGLTHLEASKGMNIARSSVTNIYKLAREKLAKFIVEGKVLNIQGGDYRLISLEEIEKIEDNSKFSKREIIDIEKIKAVYSEKKKFHGENLFCKKEEGLKRVIIPVNENNKLSNHLGQSEYLMVYDLNRDFSLENKGKIKIHRKKGAIISLILELKGDYLVMVNAGVTAKTILLMENIHIFSKEDSLVRENLTEDVNFVFNKFLDYLKKQESKWGKKEN